MIANCKIIDKCSLCNGDIENILYLCDSPLANEFVKDINIKQELFPLNLVKCKQCNNVQLDCIVDKERLYKHYHYVSSTNKENVKHFQDYANKIIVDFSLTKDDIVYEIASNDGCFLKNFKSKVIGIDPAENIAKEANKNGIFTIPAFFNEELAIELANKYGKGKIIIANNVMAHNEDLHTIVKGISKLLTDEGIFVFENSYLIDVLDKGLFDLIYSEHIYHHSITSLFKFFSKYDMHIFDVERLPNHGGSIRAYVCRAGTRKIKSIVSELLEQEKDIDSKISLFKNKIASLKTKLNNRLIHIKNEGKSIAIYGASAKATTLLYCLDINKNLIDCIYDDAPLKHSFYSPGKHISITQPNDIYEYKPNYILILAWNFANSIIEQHPNFNGTWIIPLPTYMEIIL